MDRIYGSDLYRRLRGLSRADKALLGAFLGLGLLALAVGGLAALLVALDEAGWFVPPPLRGFQLLTLHAVSAFYYWLYFAQIGVVLALLLAYTEGSRLTPPLRVLLWAGLALMAGGWGLNLGSSLSGTAVLYSAPEPLSLQFAGVRTFLLGYTLLSAGLVGVALAGVALGVQGRRESLGREWSSVGFAGFLWMALLLVAGVISLLTYVPATQQAFGVRPFLPNFNYTMAWAVFFHNMHYLPLMSTVLVWYALVETTTGVKSIFGERLSKGLFSLYLIFVPPTSLYHLFLEPEVPTGLKVVGSLLSLFISVPTLGVFLLLVTSLEACARAHGGRGLLGWMRLLPWRNPAFVAVALASVNAFGGGVVANVLIQERFAPLLSDTFAVPGYFHFFTVGTVTLTLLGALTYLLPALTGHRLAFPSLATALPYLLTVGVYLFGIAGVWAGYLGAPRRALDFTYGGAGPASWSGLMAGVGLGGLLMALAGFLYLILLATTALADLAQGRHPLDLPRASFRLAEGRGRSAWAGLLSVALLLVGMYGATLTAVSLMRSLPLGGG